MASLRRRVYGQPQEQVQVIILNLGGEELLVADLSVNTTAPALRQLVAAQLDLNSFGFDLIAVEDGVHIDGAWLLADHCPTDGSPLRLNLIQCADMPRPTTSGYMPLQESEETATGMEQDVQTAENARSKRRCWEVAKRVGIFAGALLFLGFVLDMDYRLRCLVFFVMYLMEALCMNPACRAIYNLADPNSVTAHIARIKRTAPVPQIRAKCYHYETVTRTVHYTDSEGRSRTRLETSQEKQYTRTFQEQLSVVQWRENSAQLVSYFTRLPLVQIHFSITWSPGDDETQETHERQRTALRTRAGNADTHYEYDEWVDLRDTDTPSLHGTTTSGPLWKTDIICTSGDRAPPWLNWRSYVLATVVGLSWPYRCWLARNSLSGDFRLSKTVWSHEVGLDE